MSWNFSLIMFVLLVTSGMVWTLDVCILRRRRAARARDLQARYDEAVTLAASLSGDPYHINSLRDEVQAARRAPWWVEYGASFFPILLVIFVVRSFVVEPFRIPSGSMLPTLEAGDMIVVNKFNYGLRLPLVGTKVWDIGTPARGDVVVFRYPREPAIDYIKRVVGLPGDEVAYLDKRLTVNGVEVARSRDGDYFEPDQYAYTAQYVEELGAVSHRILVNERGFQHLGPTWQFPGREHCEYLPGGVRCRVPPGHYFMMGDNRDNSLDSRYWGFVADELIVGRAFFIWMNFGKFSRIGGFD